MTEPVKEIDGKKWIAYEDIEEAIYSVGFRFNEPMTAENCCAKLNAFAADFASKAQEAQQLRATLKSVL